MKAYILKAAYEGWDGFYLSDIYADFDCCNSYAEISLDEGEKKEIIEIEVEENHFDHDYYSCINISDDQMIFSELAGAWVPEKRKLEIEEEQTDDLTNQVREYLKKFNIKDPEKFEKIVLDLVEVANFRAFLDILAGRQDRYILELLENQ